jgi:hypothetical protein
MWRPDEQQSFPLSQGLIGRYANFGVLAANQDTYSSTIGGHQLLPESIRRIATTDRRAFVTGVETWIFVLNTVLQSINALVDGNLRAFDPIIGNNSCYLSSTICVRIVQRFQDDPLYRQSIDSLRQNLVSRLGDVESLSADRCVDMPGCHLENIIAGVNHCVDLPLDVYYLAMSFGCTIAKCQTPHGTEEIDYSGLSLPSKKGASALIKHWQRELSHLGITYLQEVGARAWGEDGVWAKYIQAPHIVTDQRGRLCSPSLYATKILLHDFRFMSSDIIALDVNLYDERRSFIHRFPIFYRGCPKEGLFTRLSSDELNDIPDRPVWVISGCSYNNKHRGRDVRDIERSYSEYDLQHVVLAHEVTYPQYPKSFGDLAVSPTERKIIDEIESLRRVTGFSICNPSILCLVHLHADTVSRQRASPHRDPPKCLPYQQTQDNYQA